MEDTTQISKDHSFMLKHLFFPFPHSLSGGEEECKVSILIFILQEKVNDEKTIINHAAYSSFIHSLNKYLLNPYYVLDTMPQQVFNLPWFTEQNCLIRVISRQLCEASTFSIDLALLSSKTLLLPFLGLPFNNSTFQHLTFSYEL